METTIRPGSINDIDILANFSTKAFYETYEDHNTVEDMELYVNTHFTSDALIKNFDEPNVAFFLAFADEELAGYTKLRTVEVPAAMQNRNHLELERIYVLKKFHGYKIGFHLIQQCISYAKENHFEVLWLGVWEHNTKARTFYNKIGFQQFGEHNFVLGKDVQRDFLLKLELQ